MNFQKFFHAPATLDKLRHVVQESIIESTSDYAMKPSEDSIKAAVSHSIDTGIRETLTKISTWKLTQETFHDAFRMCVITCKRIAMKLLAEKSEDHVFQNKKPDIPIIDTSHAEVILNGREPSFLKEIQEKALKDYSDSDPKKVVSTDPSQKEISLMHSEQKKFVQVKVKSNRMWDGQDDS